jgi:hypothetical protein
MRLLPLLALPVVVAVALASGCSSGRAVALKPSQIDRTFKDLDDAKHNPFVQGKTRVDHIVTGVRSYDGFFQDAAEVKGIVVLADVILKETDGYIAKVKRAGGRGALGDAGVREFEQRQARLETISGLLAAVPDRSGALLSTGKKLATGAPKTFIGPNAAALPGVVRGLEEATEDLRDAGGRAPRLIEHATRTSASLVGLE